MNPGRAASVSLLLTLLASSQLGHSIDAIAQTGSPQPVPSAAEPLAWAIKGAMVADGTGSALVRLDVRFEGDSIREIGSLIARSTDRVIDGSGLVLAPGFIDAHNHSTDGLNSNPEADTQVSQGITTVLLGQDGSSPLPIRDYLARRRSQPAAVNVAMLVGHATVRRSVMGDDFRRESTTAEIAKMESLVDEASAEGAIGLSSGLEYEVGSYASTAELVALARVAARHGGFYISHIRDEADRTLEAVREAIAIGEQAKLPVQITHIKLGTVGVWGKAPEVVALIEAARARGMDVTADAYPYLAWHSNLKVLVPNRQWTDPASVKKALDDVGGGQNIQITRLPKFPQYVGQRLDVVARAEGISEVDLYIRIVADEDAGVIGHTMIAEDLRTFYRQPWVMVASDGGIGMSHPRGAGTFPRVLGRFVREEQWLTLQDAIRKMTSLPASRLGLKDRGVIRAGMKADLVLFDPATVGDLSTFEQPSLRARGIQMVFVNGVPVVGDPRSRNQLPGRVLVKGSR
jgi:N-acyl-D-amino-acid deacylase